MSKSLPFIIQEIWHVSSNVYNDNLSVKCQNKIERCFFFRLPVLCPPWLSTNNKPNFPYCQSMISMYDLLVVIVWKIVKKRSSILLVFHVDNVAEIAWHVQALFNDCHSIWRLVLGYRIIVNLTFPQK